MKVTYSLLTTATLLGLSSAQGALPPCAQGCVSKFTSGSSISGCSNINVMCICSNSDFLSNIACCLADVCSPADQQAAVDYAKNICSIAGVTNLPASVSCASTATTASPTSGASSTGTGSSSAATNSSTSLSGQSSASSQASSASSTASSMSSHTGSAASAATGSGATTGSSTSSAAPSATKNAGLHNAAGVGAGVLGGFAAVVALL